MAFGNRVWQKWKRIAGIIGDFQARVVLSLFYFVVVAPFGLGVRLFGGAPATRGARRTNWTDFAERSQTLETARRQS